MSKRKLSLITYGTVVVFFMFLMALVFWGGNDWKFINGWLFWSAFCIPTLMITAYFLKKDPELIERRILPKESRPTQIIGQSVAGLLFVVLILLSALDHRFIWTRVPFSISLLADMCIVIGFGIVFQVFKVNSFASRAIETMSRQKVITSGPYAIIRHPMYAGALMILFSIPLALGSLTGLMLVLPLIIVIILRILDEEKMLNRDLAGYTDYCQVCQYRLIPHIW